MKKTGITDSTYSISNNTSRVRCDKSVENSSILVKQFNYESFTSYLQVRNQLEKNERISSIKAGKKVLGLSDYTDQVLGQELVAIYGEMNQESPEFVKIFSNYKEERLEEVSEWINEEAQVLHFDDGQSKQDLFSRFPKEIHMFSEVHRGVESGIERFILPRHQLKKPDLPLFLERCRQTNTINLAEFDPQIQLPSNYMPDNTETSNIGEQLGSVLQEMIHRYPFGINAIELNLIFKNDKKYTPDCNNLGYNNFTDLIAKQRRIIWPQQYKNGILMFPTYLQGFISTPMEIYWKILHQFKIILSFSCGVVKVSDAIVLYENVFGFKLGTDKMKSWGFNTAEDFVQFLFTHWSHSEIKCLRLHEFMPISNSSSTTNCLYLLHYNEKSKNLITKCLSKKPQVFNINNNNAAIIKSIKPPSAPSQLAYSQNGAQGNQRIPANCVYYDAQLEYEIHRVPKRRDIQCRLTYYRNPTFFHVMLDKNVHELESLGCTLRNEYSQKQNQYLHVNNPKLLRKNLLLVVKDGEDFYRATYLEQLNSNEHKLESIDYGYVFYAGIENMWFLLSTFCFDFPAQAIPCQLFNVLEQTNWDKSVSDHCCDLLHTEVNEILQPITVSFKEFTTNAKGQTVCLVRVVGANRGKMPDIGNAVNEFLKKSSFKSAEDINKKKQTNTLSVKPKTLTVTKDGFHLNANAAPFIPKAFKFEQNSGPIIDKTNPWGNRQATSATEKKCGEKKVEQHFSTIKFESTQINTVRTQPQITCQNSISQSRTWAEIAAEKEKLKAKKKQAQSNFLDFPPL